MKYQFIFIFILSVLISANGIIAYADQTTDDENTVVGACMVKKFKEKVPPIEESTMTKCANVDSEAAPKCLGLSQDEYITFVKFCVAQLINDKCIAAKMKVPLIQYADCGYEQDPVACFKTLGYTPEAILKLSDDCQKELAK